MEKIIPEIQSDLRRIDLLAAEIRGMTTMLAKPMVLDNEMLDQMVESLRSEASMLSKKIEEQLAKWDGILSVDLLNLNRLAEKQKIPLLDTRGGQ